MVLHFNFPSLIRSVITNYGAPDFLTINRVTLAFLLRLYPNPAANIVNLYTKGLQQSKPAILPIISFSGNVLKKVQTTSAAPAQLDVSSLVKGVYTIKIVSGEKVMFKQFVKL